MSIGNGCPKPSPSFTIELSRDNTSSTFADSLPHRIFNAYLFVAKAWPTAG